MVDGFFACPRLSYCRPVECSKETTDEQSLKGKLCHLGNRQGVSLEEHSLEGIKELLDNALDGRQGRVGLA